MGFPDSTTPFLAVLLCDIANTILRNGLGMFDPSPGRSKAAILVFIILASFTTIVFFIANISISDNKKWYKAECSRIFYQYICCCSSSCYSNNKETGQQHDQLDTQETNSSSQNLRTDYRKYENSSEATNTETNGQTDEQLNVEAKKQEKKDSKIFEIIFILISVLSVLSYFIGDNLTAFVEIYGTDLGCSGKCIQKYRNLSVILLVFSLLSRSSLICQPIKIFVKPKAKEEKIPGKTIAKSFVHMYKMDTINTALALAVETSEFCDPDSLFITWRLVALCASAGIISILIKGILACTNYTNPQNNDDADNKENIEKSKDRENAKNSKEDEKKCIIVCMCTLLSIAFVLYLLFDNDMPMDCYFSQVQVNYVTRILFMILVALFVLVAARLNCYYVEHLSQKPIDFGMRD